MCAGTLMDKDHRVETAVHMRVLPIWQNGKFVFVYTTI